MRRHADGERNRKTGKVYRSASARAAGATWGPVTDHAPWAARYWHTTVIDAAGNIYLMGGAGDGGDGDGGESGGGG